MEQRINALLIEDDPDYALLMGLHLNDACGPDVRYAMECAETLAQGLELLSTKDFDAVLLDLMLPDCQGLEGLCAIRGRAPDLPVVVMTNLNDEEIGLQAIARGAQDFLIKEKVDARTLKRAIGYALERSRLLSQLESIIGGSAEGMVVVERGGKVLYLNAAALAFFGQTPESLLGRSFDFPLRPGTVREIRWTAAGAEKIAQLRVTELEWRKDKAYLASIHDITELRKVEHLKAEIRERRRVDELKDQFMSTVSHELRSPLTVIKASVANLWDGLAGPMTKPQGQLVSIAARNVERLSRIINNLLDLSRLESGRARVDLQDVDLCKLIRETVQGARLMDPQGRVAMELKLPSPSPHALADPDMLTQILQNLLDNGLRYAKSRLTIETGELSAGELRVTIDDDGPGIPEASLPQLFNKFVQVNRPTGGGGYKGTGLGLAICQEIIGLMGGRIWAESAAGRGARFHFSAHDRKL
ncbi:MAG: response regulator [Elusimicrobia bacterium]|nr:response regulator [Elusimicrobiota bacterium]